MVQTGPHIAGAFALTIGAGMATLLGGLPVFSPRLLGYIGSDKLLGGTLGLAAGAMMYVTLMEIMPEAHVRFLKAGVGEQNAYLYSTLCFFGGLAVVTVLDMLVHAIYPDMPHVGDLQSHQMQQIAGHTACADTPAEVLPDRGWQDMCDDGESTADGSTQGVVSGQPTKLGGGSQHGQGGPTSASPLPTDWSTVTVHADTLTKDQGRALTLVRKRQLHRAGTLTALAISIHNFPEGMATFVGAVGDPKLGAGLALAIAVHNIPEGLAIAIPLYFSLGSASKAFFYVAVSAAAEPLAAVFAWLVFSSQMSDKTMGMLFGFVGGIMSLVTLQELLPSAHAHDIHDRVVSKCLVAGMAFMAMSLLLIMYV